MPELDARVRPAYGRPVLVINGELTTETWAYGWPNAMPDFAAAGLRICQFHVAAQPWWLGEGAYDFGPIERQIDEFIQIAPHVLLIPRVCFGYQGEGWWAERNPDELSVAKNPVGETLTTPDGGRLRVDVPQLAASNQWAGDAARAMADFVEHFERRNGENILGYHVGAGVSVEWFRWWTYIERAYEDYSPIAQEAFRRWLRAACGDSETLQQAWGRRYVTLENATVPSPERLDQPRLGFLRDAATERDAVDWWLCLSDLNAGQAIALCRAAKDACGGRKIVGAFYGYMFPHWNNQNPARTGHLSLRMLLECDAIDYISSPYHYDNRNVGGFHHSQTVPQAIERAGKLHVDETDTVTHCAPKTDWLACIRHQATTREKSIRLLRRDAAAVLGTAGGMWWMDLKHERWYSDPEIIAAVREMNELAKETLERPCNSHAELALVVDERSWAYCDVNSNLNLYFTSLPRQLEWSDIGVPFDTVLRSELLPGGALANRDYKLHVFLNTWRIDRDQRPALLERVRRPGVTSVWFHAAGFYDEAGGSVGNVESLTGIPLSSQQETIIPEIDILPSGHPLLDAESFATPRGESRFGRGLAIPWSPR